MPGPLSIVPPLLLAVVFAASAIGKLRHPDDPSGWADLGIPLALRRPWLVRVHPWSELVLAVALAAFGGILGSLAGLAAALLLTGYTWLLWRVLRRADSTDASCACFGSRRPVTGRTVVRNAWLLLLAIAAASTAWANPGWGGPLAAVRDDWGWVLALVATAVTALLVVEPTDETTATLPRSATPAAAADSDGLEYVRARTPAVPVMLADGTTVNLRALTERRPVLLFAVSEACGACDEVIAQIPAWRVLLPEIDLRMLLMPPPEHSRLTEHDEPQSLHDPNGYVRGSISDWHTPTAVLLGVDGLLAGGPTSGTDEIAVFVGDVYESLHGERPVAEPS